MQVHSVVTKRNKNPQKGHGFERCSRSWFLGEGGAWAYQWETHSLGQVNNRSIHLALR
jgi:hypothetical protein